MPVHDWTRVSAGDFHAFHQNWITYLAAALNTGGLPDEYEALPEPVSGKYIPDVITLRTGPRTGVGGTAMATAPPTARQVLSIERSNYLRRKNRLVVRHGRGRW